MADAQLILSRRALLGVALASPVLPSAHPEQASSLSRRGVEGRPPPLEQWDRALARFQAAQAAVDAATGEPDQERYDALVDSADESMCALLRSPAPNLAAIAAKLDIIVAHLAWELTGSEECLEILRRDARRLAAAAM